VVRHDNWGRCRPGSNRGSTCSLDGCGRAYRKRDLSPILLLFLYYFSISGGISVGMLLIVASLLGLIDSS
jgi:hypothetical protein